MRPFLKWAGSKRWLIRNGLDVPEFKRYVEPFVGSGAVFFDLLPRAAILSDTNVLLVNCFNQIKYHHAEVYDVYARLFRDHSEDNYYKVRDELEDGTIYGAAQFIYLNRTCFNGVFRVNLAGKFNVPIGSKVSDPFDAIDFEQWSCALQYAHISSADFEETIDMSNRGDFLFVDPPYTVAHNQNGFIAYNEKIFSWSDQVRLANSLRRASDRGVEFLLTNANHESVRELYSGHFSIESIDRRSAIAANVEKRRPISEVLIRTYS